MTPKEKAEELLGKYSITLSMYSWTSFVKQCALIAVDEIVKAIDFDWMERQNLEREFNYWQQVKEEIEKL